MAARSALAAEASVFSVSVVIARSRYFASPRWGSVQQTADARLEPRPRPGFQQGPVEDVDTEVPQVLGDQAPVVEDFGPAERVVGVDLAVRLVDARLGVVLADADVPGRDFGLRSCGAFGATAPGVASQTWRAASSPRVCQNTSVVKT
jgi:hypothetical protein